MVTLTDDHREILTVLGSNDSDVEALSDVLDEDRETVTALLAELAENGLVRETATGWTRTEDGRRVLASPGDGSVDERIDMPELAERAIETFQLRPDEADAVRGCYVLLRNWDTATRAELVDAVFAEHPAGFDDPDAWWDGLVEAHLDSLPGTVSPDDPEGQWRSVDSASEADGPDEEIAGDEAGDPGERSDDDGICPVCETAYASRSFHPTADTIVPARDARSCVLTTQTDEGDGITIYYHG